MAKKPRTSAKKKKPVSRAKPRGKRAKAAPKPSAEEIAAREASVARRRGAVGAYERGLAAIQRRDFREASDSFTAVLEEFAEEHDLHDRSRLYLRVCARELTASAQEPTTVEELVYAATLALNNAAHDESLGHLKKAVGLDADDEQAHYMLAVVYAQTDRLDLAASHLERAVELEPENRTLARQEPDFEALREIDQVQHVLEPAAATRRRPRRLTR